MLLLMNAKIKEISSKIISDSQGHNTIQTTIILENNSQGSFSVPSGTSTGGYEAVPVDAAKAVDLINNSLKKVLEGRVFDSGELDNFLITKDGTENKSNLGANTILSISIAFIKALAVSLNQPLFSFTQSFMDKTSSTKPSIPRLMLNLIEGGKHADFALDFQEYLLIPGFETTSESLEFAKKVLTDLKVKLGSSVKDGFEGGLAIQNLSSNEQNLSLLN